MKERLQVRVNGRVQGVGFRPFVYRLAQQHHLAGWVRNDGEGVVLEVEGAEAAAFLGGLRNRTPPLARIEHLDVRRVAPQGAPGFSICPSAQDTACATMIGPDVAICDDCLADLFDPADRRYRYPFLNCTQCGPRYTITRSLPYDRPRTAMAGFALCADCEREYLNPLDRRFHAQPLACAACGPTLSLPPEAILTHLEAGAIVALKGLGGYHLACDARDPAAVARLRVRKGRDAKPFAVMVASVDAARGYADVDPTAASLLADPARPIVLLRSKSTGLAPEIAPELDAIGLMLPYTPLHYLLFHEAAGRPEGTAWLKTAPPDLALVMTSANLNGEPLVIDDDEAREHLSGIADVIVSHDRPILVRADDSVVQAGPDGPVLVRRSRGLVPGALALPRLGPPVLALGAHLKATICVTRGDRAVLSQHIGDLDKARTRAALEAAVRHLQNLLEVEPEIVAHDLHPDLFTTRLAETWPAARIAVQHHHAHIAAVLAEHGRTGPVLGLALDGLGYGPDGTVWGGELLQVDGASFARLGHLRHLPLPGGDLAAREPWRMAAAALHLLGRGDEIERRFAAAGPADRITALLRSSWPMPRTSSLGRWFDAAAALLGVATHAHYEGHAAMALEARVGTPRVMTHGWTIDDDGRLNLLPLLDRIATLDAGEGADLWHGTLGAALVAWTRRAAATSGLRTVALGGGCLLNRTLRSEVARGLRDGGLEVLLPVQVPPNDGGLSLGQAWVALEVSRRV